MIQARAVLAPKARKKSATVAYALWFFLSSFGAHRFYLGRTGSAMAILFLTIVSIPAMFIGIGLILIWVPTIWCFVDLFLIPAMTRDYNMRAIQRIAWAHGLDRRHEHR